MDNNSPFWSNAYANLSNLNAFVVQPSGVTPWGDDWHGAWSFADAESAREGVVKWSHCMRSCVDYKFWFWVPTIITGHSNGGLTLRKRDVDCRTRCLVCLDALE